MEEEDKKKTFSVEFWQVVDIVLTVYNGLHTASSKLGFYSFKLDFEKFGPIKCCVLNFHKPFILIKLWLLAAGRHGGWGEGCLLEGSE